VDPIQARNGRIADQLLGLTSHPRNAPFFQMILDY
jgi:hypothetical protein